MCTSVKVNNPVSVADVMNALPVADSVVPESVTSKIHLKVNVFPAASVTELAPMYSIF